MNDDIKKTDKLYEEVSKHLLDDCEADSAFIAKTVNDYSEEIGVVVGLLTDSERVERAVSFVEEMKSKDNFGNVEHKLAAYNRKKRLGRFVKIVSSVAAALVVFYFGVDAILKKEESYTEAPKLVTNLPIIKTYSGESYNITTEGVNVNGVKIKEGADEHEIILENNVSDTEDNTTATNDISDEILLNEIVIPSGNNYKLILADGSIVILNSESKLKYPAKDNGDIREVYLDGEGYFKVVKSDRPFIVRSGDVSIKVYGTEFNVKMYENKIETILVSGSVGLKANKGEETMMTPNQMATYCNESEEITVKDIVPYISWLDNSFKYVETPLEDVIYDIEKWYGVTFGDFEEYKDKPVTMFTSRKSSVTNLVSLLEKAIGIMIIREGGNEYKLE